MKGTALETKRQKETTHACLPRTCSCSSPGSLSTTVKPRNPSTGPVSVCEIGRRGNGRTRPLHRRQKEGEKPDFGCSVNAGVWAPREGAIKEPVSRRAHIAHIRVSATPMTKQRATLQQREINTKKCASGTPCLTSPATAAEMDQGNPWFTHAVITNRHTLRGPCLYRRWCRKAMDILPKFVLKRQEYVVLA